jgi:succinate dehydrogenase/fumarate reductase flavoprotein subunit
LKGEFITFEPSHLRVTRALRVRRDGRDGERTFAFAREKRKKTPCRTFADERRRVDGDRSDDASVRRGLRLARRDAEHDAEDTQPRGACDRDRKPFPFFRD